MPLSLQRKLIDSLNSWGVWPACVMVTSQWEITRILKLDVQWPLSLLILVGTLAIYGSDRWLERINLKKIAARHRAFLPVDMTISTIILGAGLLSLYYLGTAILIWMLSLGLLGALYLLTTIGKCPNIIITKELIGACCFAWLATGAQSLFEPIFFALIFTLGLSNFLWSSHQDKERDVSNGLKSFAILRPTWNMALARLFAFFSFSIGLMNLGFTSPLLLVSLFHAFWLPKWRGSIDLAFLPLLSVPFFNIVF